MSEDEGRPSWWDESRVVSAQFAPGYGGHVVDLGDGTCRLANSPLLGKHGPKWGDRVDLFWPLEKGVRPFIGYRIYDDGVEPAGRHVGGKEHVDE